MRESKERALGNIWPAKEPLSKTESGRASTLHSLRAAKASCSMHCVEIRHISSRSFDEHSRDGIGEERRQREEGLDATQGTARIKSVDWKELLLECQANPPIVTAGAN